MTDVYREVHVLAQDEPTSDKPSRAMQRRKRDAATTAEELGPSDLMLDAALTLKGEEYASKNQGSMASTFIAPLPIDMLYKVICEELVFVKPNDGFIRTFPAMATTYSLTSITTRGCYLGGKGGVAAVVELLDLAVNVREVDLSGQNIDPEVMLRLVAVIRNHPRLQRVDLRGNFVENEAARLLIHAAQVNGHLQSVEVDADCRIQPSVQKRLNQQLKQNAQIMRNVSVESKASLRRVPPILNSGIRRQCTTLSASELATVLDA